MPKKRHGTWSRLGGADAWYNGITLKEWLGPRLTKRLRLSCSTSFDRGDPHIASESLHELDILDWYTRGLMAEVRTTVMWTPDWHTYLPTRMRVYRPGEKKVWGTKATETPWVRTGHKTCSVCLFVFGSSTDQAGCISHHADL